MTNKTVHILIGQQIANILEDSNETTYSLSQKGFHQNNLKAVTQNKDVSYTLNTLLKICKELNITSINIDLKKESVLLKTE